MSEDQDQTNSLASEFDFSSYPSDSLFHERRTGTERRREPTEADSAASRSNSGAGGERRIRRERRRRIDPTTFEKQYSEDEMEFMNAMQRFKELSGKSFPTYGDVLKVAIGLGYRRGIKAIDSLCDDAIEPSQPVNLLDPVGDQS
jgi:hypothetical protein